MPTPRLHLMLVAGAALCLAGGCATKSFVREEIAKAEGRTGESVGQLDQKLGQERTRTDSLSGQVTEGRNRAEAAGTAAGQAAQRADLAGQRADQAAGVAAQAAARADQTDARLTKLWANRSKQNLGATVTVRFAFDRWKLDDRAETALLDVIKTLEDNPNVVVDLEGYTDNVGQIAYNLTLSQRRVDAVRRYLVEKGVELHRIQAIGFGDGRPVADNKTKDGRDQNRRVVLKLFDPVE